MLTAAQHQLLVVSKRVEVLQSEVQSKLETVKGLRRERDDIDAHVEALRNELAQAEAEQEDVHSEQQRQEASLRDVAHDFASTQLLQRRFRNALREGQGFNRSLVWVVNKDDDDDAASPPSSDPPLVKLADECTIALPTTRRTFVVDGVAEVVVSASGGLLYTADGDSSCSDSDHTSSDNDDAYNRTNIKSKNNNGGNGNGGGQFTSTLKASVEEACKGYNLHFVGLEEGSLAGVESSSHPDGRSALNNMNDDDDMGDRHHGHARRLEVGGPSQPPVLPSETMMFGTINNNNNNVGGGGGGGIARQFAASFFESMNELDITHFNLRATFAEVAPEGLYDLLDVSEGGNQHQQPRGVPLPVAKFPLSHSDGGKHHLGGGRLNSNGTVRSEPQAPADLEVSSMQLHTIEEFTEMVECALSNRSHRLHDRYSSELSTPGDASPPTATLAALFGGHLILTLYLETFNSRGNYRRSCVVFAGVAAGAARIDAIPGFHHQATSRRNNNNLTTSEQQWVARGYAAVTEGISVAAASSLQVASGLCQRGHQQQQLTTFDECMEVLDTTGEGSSSNPAPPIARSLSQLELPHQRSTRIVAAIREMFGGNSRGVLCCAVRRLEVGGDEEDTQRQINSTDDLLSYAHHFKSTANEAVPYDLPPELQRLTEAMSAQQAHHQHGGGSGRDQVLNTNSRSGGGGGSLNTSALLGRRSSRTGDGDVLPPVNNTRSHGVSNATPASSERAHKHQQPTQQHRNGLTMSRTSSMASNDGYTATGAAPNHQRAAPPQSSQHPSQAPPPQHVPIPTTATTTRRFVAGMPLSAVVPPSSSSSAVQVPSSRQPQQYGTRPPSGTTSHNTSQYHNNEERHQPQYPPRSLSSHSRDDDAVPQHHQPSPSSLDRSYHDHFDPRSALGEESESRPRFAKSNHNHHGGGGNTHSSQLMGRGYPIKGDTQYRI